MLDDEYDSLIHYIEGMISDGVKLVHGGRVYEWVDTKILDQIAKIKELKEGLASPVLNSGDLLKNRYSGQNMWVINCEEENVFLNPDSPTIKYPLDKISEEFIIVKKITK
jgi:hypothetical protein